MSPPLKTDPHSPGIYPVVLCTGSRWCAKWDGTQWLMWHASGPWPEIEWKPIVKLGLRVTEWVLP